MVGLGSILVVALVLALASPKAVHAVVATLVTVSNTSANPVSVTQGIDLAEEPFATMLCSDNASGSTCATVSTVLGLGPSALPSSFTVPATDSAGNAVKALVIQFVSGSCGAITVDLTTTVPANAVNGVTTVLNPLSLRAQPAPSSTSLAGAPVVNQTTSIVARPGSTVGLLVGFAPGTPVCLIAVNGYLAH
jgi:hypothetical protein